MSDIIRVHDQYYILADSVFIDESKWVLKDGDTFSVWDRYGDARPIGMGEHGIYHEGTRFLSHYIFRMANKRPLILNSTVSENNVIGLANFTNPDIQQIGGIWTPRGILHVFRSKFFWKNICYEKIKIWNLGQESVSTEVSLSYGADFSDIFEVRGIKRAKKGDPQESKIGESSVVLSYLGLDGVVRRTRIEAYPQPKTIDESEMRFELNLPPKGQATYLFTISCHYGDAPSRVLLFDHAFEEAEESRRQTQEQYCRIESSNEHFNEWIKRAYSDLQMMTTNTPKGMYPYAGVPWFSTTFGRDGIITALECLWVNPDIAKGVLQYLASTQATEVVPEQDAEPGKILHESRKGEMAALREIPFGHYYGSVDSTPLFLYLAGAYYERTGDRGLIEILWPNLARAMEWINRYGDQDGDGFVEYRENNFGLTHQGWKDSDDSIFHADGSLAQGPIALCEVQAYVYGAKKKMAMLAEILGKPKEAAAWRREAETLKSRFTQTFWLEDLGILALALDGKKKPCQVRASNAGHCLFAGIVSPEHAARIADTLMGHEFFSGWGIRTVASCEPRYNPMSYHNGSIWPHDNALICRGMGFYNLKEPCLRIMDAFFESSEYFDLWRLPELFCGFARHSEESPIQYPVACSPQSWASAAPLYFLQSCLGIEIDGTRGRVNFNHPRLPTFMNELRIRNLRIGTDSIDLHLRREYHDVKIEVTDRRGNIEIGIH